MTFNANKSIHSVSKSGQPYYSSRFNIIEAVNNDGMNKLNKATFSIELVVKLLSMYCKPNYNNDKDILVYDSFMGTGTTAVGCIQYGVNFIGSEIDEKQCALAEKRIKGMSLKDINKNIDKNTKKLF